MMAAQQSVGDVTAALPRPHVGGSGSTSDRRGEYSPLDKEEAENRGNDSAVDQDEDAGAADKPDDADENKKAEATGATKKSRRELPPHTVAILKGWMLSPEHVKHPYPTDEDKQMLLRKTGINMKQLTNWFTNARKRIWKPMMRREHSRQLQSVMEFDKSRPRDMFPGATSVGYAEGAYGHRGVSHSFDAGSIGPPRDPQLPYDPYGRRHPPSVVGYSPSIPPATPLYPPRPVRSMSEAPARSEVDEYINAMQIRKRLHDREDSAGMPGDYEHSDKRMRTSMTPRGLKVLQDWVNTRVHAEYPFPNDSERVQLSRETGLDIGQIDAWIKSLHERAVGVTGVPSPQHGTNYGPPPGVAAGGPSAPLRSIPGRDNPQFPPPPSAAAAGAGYGAQRRSIPSAGNSLFPPRPTASMRSIPSAGNPQFPPPPAARRETSDSERGSSFYSASASNGYPASSAAYSPPDALRSNRSLSISAGQYLYPPPPTPTGQQAPTAASAHGVAGGLPSLSSRNLLNRPATPTMGQPRDSRSHTLDMSQFADARRRRMNFQDILASTKNAAVPEPSTGLVAQASNSENVYPNRAMPAYPPARYDAQHQKSSTRGTECQHCGQATGSCACNERATGEAGSVV